MTENQLRQKVVSIMQGWLGYKESNGTHKKIIDIYNKHKPLAVGYKVKYTDEWCATTVSAAFIQAGLTDIAPTECSCPRMIELYKKIGRWEEKDTYKPNPGDIIMYDWQDSGVGDNTGTPDHVGIVVSVSGNTMQIIEGNKSESVMYRSLTVGGKNIRGYCLPNYASKATKASAPSKSVEAVAKEVLAGKWGNGTTRKAKLEAAGYNYSEVQAMVNALASGKKSVTEIAKEVIAGKWGTGNTRKQKLTAAGYDYNAVQKKVNELLK